MSRSTRSIARRYGLHHGDVATRAMTHHVTPLRAARQLALERARYRPFGLVAQDAWDSIADLIAAADQIAALASRTPTERRAATNSRNGEPHA